MRSNPFYELPSNAMVTGSAEALIDAFFGPKQHDQHCQLWRWHCYTSGNFHYSPPHSNRIVYGVRA